MSAGFDRTAPEYEGLVTRTIAFALDAAAINVIAVVVGAGVSLSLSVFSIPSGVKTVLLAIGGVAYVLWGVAYFVTFWSTTGQTLGNRVMEIRVCRSETGEVLRPARALLRFGALMLAAIPLLLGFFPILTDDRRRGLHDMLARTVVVGVPRSIADVVTPAAEQVPGPTRIQSRWSRPIG